MRRPNLPSWSKTAVNSSAVFVAAWCLGGGREGGVYGYLIAVMIVVLYALLFGDWACTSCHSNDDLQFYGGDKTIHRTGHLDVETYNGEVVSVWFRCMRLPFEQHTVNLERAREMLNTKDDIEIDSFNLKRAHD